MKAKNMITQDWQFALLVAAIAALVFVLYGYVFATATQRKAVNREYPKQSCQIITRHWGSTVATPPMVVRATEHEDYTEIERWVPVLGKDGFTADLELTDRYMSPNANRISTEQFLRNETYRHQTRPRPEIFPVQEWKQAKRGTVYGIVGNNVRFASPADLKDLEDIVKEAKSVTGGMSKPTKTKRGE